MKLPNGYGSVTKLSGNRRKPYLARVTLGWITDEQTGKTVQNRVPLGTFKTKKEALQALAEYGANPYDIQKCRYDPGGTLRQMDCSLLPYPGK